MTLTEFKNKGCLEIDFCIFSLNDSPRRTQRTQKIIKLKEFEKNQLFIHFIKIIEIQSLIKYIKSSLCAQCSLWFMN